VFPEIAAAGAALPSHFKISAVILSSLGGGTLVLGLHQTSEGNIEVSGLSKIKD
jgi:hypothetical protein